MVLRINVNFTNSSLKYKPSQICQRHRNHGRLEMSKGDVQKISTRTRNTLLLTHVLGFVVFLLLLYNILTNTVITLRCLWTDSTELVTGWDILEVTGVWTGKRAGCSFGLYSGKHRYVHTCVNRHVCTHTFSCPLPS